ncbi:MAG: hypothetical protein IJ133_06360 [Clostridia bacterium]|nr:hypothetical protein [Clostridia bacterium]
MKHMRALRVLSLLLVLVFSALALSSCGKKQTAAPLEYDESRYVLSDYLDGAEFLLPRSMYDVREDFSNFSLYNKQEQTHHSFEWTGENMYALVRPGDCGVYAFFNGKIDHAIGVREAEKIPAALGITAVMELEGIDNWFQTSTDPDTGDIRNTFKVRIHEKDKDLWYNGYATMLRRFSDARIYFYVDGFDDESRDKEALYMANSFRVLPA